MNQSSPDKSRSHLIIRLWDWFKRVGDIIMTQFSVNTERFDPYKQFKFRVIWDGKVIPGICKISGLIRITEPLFHREGGDPTISRKSPGQTTYEPIVLERGRTHDDAFEKWANLVHNYQGDAAMSLKNFRKDITIELLNMQGSAVMAFKVYRCWPSKYCPLPELDANKTCVAFESITLQNEGWERDEDVTEPTEW